jgi:hypothetical protein
MAPSACRPSTADPGGAPLHPQIERPCHFPFPNPAARAPFFPIVDGGAGYLRPRPGQRNMGGALAELSANQGQRRAWPSPARRCGSIFSGEVNQGRRRAHN